MVNEKTMQKLYGMRLAAMALAWEEQQGDAKHAILSFDDRFGLLVEAEHLARDNRRLQRLLKAAELRIGTACIEDVKTSTKRGLDQQRLHELGTLGWVSKNVNVLITGKTGVGKSYLACEGVRFSVYGPCGKWSLRNAISEENGELQEGFGPGDTGLAPSFLSVLVGEEKQLECRLIRRESSSSLDHLAYAAM